MFGPPEEALLAIGRWLDSERYAFTTPTPATHARVIARSPEALAKDLRDVFGWSRPFERRLLPERIITLLAEARVLREDGGVLRSEVRFSRLADQLYAHSAWPTDRQDSVFFGPDTYRYARFLQRLSGRFARAVDVGAGSGAGLLSIHERCDHLVLTDINPRALQLTAVNAALNGAKTPELRLTSILDGVDGPFDLIASNPPFLVDDAARAYRHGGERGIQLSIDIVRAALPKLGPKGTLALYTATPVVNGVELFRSAVTPLLREARVSHTYEEIDVDVFGEELDRPAYADVERISVVSLLAARTSS